MAASVATPLEKQFATIAGVTSISSSNSQGSTNITLQFDLNRSIDAAAQDVQSMIARTLAIAAARHAVAAVVPQGQPGRRAGPVPDAELDTLPLSEVDHYAETVLGAAAVDGQRRGAGQRLRRAEVRRARRRRSDAARVAPDRHRPGRPAITGANANRPTGTLYGAAAQLRRADEGQLMDAAGVPASCRRLSQRQPDPPRRGRERLRRRRERQDGELVQRHARHLPRDSAPAGHEHGGSRRRHPRAAAAAPAQLPGAAHAGDPQRSIGVDPRIGATTSSSRCC